MDIPGTWTLHYSWGCVGSYSQTDVIFNANGTFSSSPYTGKWVQTDGDLLFRFDQAPNTVYGGSGVGSAITGIMSTFQGSNGCWYAVKSGAGLAAVQKSALDVAGVKA